MGKKVLVTGATGMIGGLILEHCLQSPEISQVVSLVRKPSGVTHQKLDEMIIDDFLVLDEDEDYFKAVDIVYYCLGVYTGAVDRETFRMITVAYPETLARAVKRHSPEVSFCLLSGGGADRNEKSRMMFARDKGAIENRLSGMGFTSFHTFRPSYIYPVSPRQEPNLSYRLMRPMYPLLKLFGSKASIRSTELAASMFFVGLNGGDREIFENKDILELHSSENLG